MADNLKSGRMGNFTSFDHIFFMLTEAGIRKLVIGKHKLSQQYLTVKKCL